MTKTKPKKEKAKESRTWVVRFQDGLEWVIEARTCYQRGDVLVFEGIDGTEQLCPVHTLVVARSTLEKPKASTEEAVLAQKIVKGTAVPETARDNFITESEREGGRFVIRDTPSGCTIHDVEKDSAWEYSELPEMLRDLVDLANAGTEAVRTGQYKGELRKKAILSIYIFDDDDKPAMRMSRERFDEMILKHDLKQINTPMVENRHGERFRIEFTKKDEVLFIPAHIDTESPFKTETIEGRIPTSQMKGVEE